MIFRREYGKTNISTIIERQTRYTILIKNPDRQSQPLIDQIKSSLQELAPLACKTITFDRGTEFASYRLLDQEIGMQAYFCAPHAPWQKRWRRKHQWPCSALPPQRN